MNSSLINSPSTAPGIPAALPKRPFGSSRIVGVSRSGKSVIARTNESGRPGSHRPLILSPLSVLPV